MKATAKIEAFGVKALADQVGVDVVTIYRWKRALDDGKGIPDHNKRILVQATAGAEHPIEYADFFPPEFDTPVDRSARRPGRRRLAP